MNSLDRKLARCAREIEEAKPKTLSYFDFENTPYEWARTPTGEWKEVTPFVGKSNAPDSPVAAPPSQQAQEDALRRFKWIGKAEPCISHFLVKIDGGRCGWAASNASWEKQSGWIDTKRPFEDEFPKDLYEEVSE